MGLTMSQLPLLWQQQHIHVVMFLQSSCEHSTLAAEQEDQRQAEVFSGVPISNHLEERSLHTIASLTVV